MGSYLTNQKPSLFNAICSYTSDARLTELVAKPKCREPNRVNWKAIVTMCFEPVDLYAEFWSKREQVELKYLPEWKDQLKELAAERILNLNWHFKSPERKVLNQAYLKDTLHELHNHYVLVPVDKAVGNVIVVCKKYYIETLAEASGINNPGSTNSTYIPTGDSYEVPTSI